MQVGGYLQQQAHDDEFGCANAESAGGKGEDGNWHGSAPDHWTDRPEMASCRRWN
jgi:hypothetical protein